MDTLLQQKIKQKTQTRQMVGLLIFGLALLAGIGVFIIKEPAKEETAVKQCLSFSEQECLENGAVCQGIFTNNAEFIECKQLSEQQQAQRRAVQQLCGQTGGQYVGARLGNYCQCEFPAAWRVGAGCK